MSDESHTILVVDDNEWNRDMLSRRLKRKGFEILVANDGRQALELVEREPIDLILLDIMMPGISGIEVLKEIRQRHNPDDLPVIMATAKDHSDDMVEAFELGANDYVTKPLDFPVVLARVQAQLRTKVPARIQATQESPAEEAVGKGTILGGRYRLEERLGKGNFGAVYRALHLDLERPVAVKVLDTKLEASSANLARFRLEGISACRLQHPNAVTVLDFGVTEAGTAFLVMELLEGKSLHQELSLQERLSPRRCAEILFPICDVLTESHAAGIIHRDIKPANIFLHKTRRGEMVKVLDFGIAKIVGEAAVQQKLTLEGGVLGTPAYMAPERLRKGEYDGRADIYSLGVMLFEMLTGQLPFSTESADPLVLALMHLNEEPRRLREADPSSSPALERVVMSTLEKDFRRRPTAGALARGFAAALGLPAPRGPLSELESSETPARGWPLANLQSPPEDETQRLPTDLQPLPGSEPEEEREPSPWEKRRRDRSRPEQDPDEDHETWPDPYSGKPSKR